MPNKIHTITVLDDANGLVGKRVKVVNINPAFPTFSQYIGQVGYYMGNADVDIDDWIVNFYWGLQIQEVGDE
jgi:hypothetical protein